MRKSYAQPQGDVALLNPPAAEVVDGEQERQCEEPADDFLTHLQERLSLDAAAAAETLASWLSSYEPSPLALARAGLRNQRSTQAQDLAA